MLSSARFVVLFFAFAATGCGGGGGSSLPAAVASVATNAGNTANAIAGTAPSSGTTTTGGTTTGGTTTGGTATGGTTTGGTTSSTVPTLTAASGCGAAPALQNGIEYPASWAPYNCTSSPWNQRVSASPTFASYSSGVIMTEFGGGNSQPVRNEEAGPYDYGHPVYYASATDPIVTLHCTQYCNRVDNGGLPATVHLPALARPAGGTDAHMAVIQPDGTEIDMWATQQRTGNWTTGSTVTAQGMANCGNFASGSGFTPIGPAATAGGACVGAGLLRADELLAGSIPHALFLISQCAVGWQYPTFPGAATDTCTSGNGPPLGGRLWYDVPDATTNADLALQPWERAILNALHDYGGYLEDDLSGAANVSGIGFLAESDQASVMFGTTDPFAALTAQAWTAITIPGSLSTRYIGADTWTPSGVNFAAHLHWLDACSAKRTC